MSLGLVDGDSKTVTSAFVAPTITTSILRLPSGAVNGYVLTSDAVGEAAWEALPPPSTISSSSTAIGIKSRPEPSTSYGIVSRSGALVTLYLYLTNPSSDTLSLTAGSVIASLPAGYAPALSDTVKRTNVVILTHSSGAYFASFSTSSLTPNDIVVPSGADTQFTTKAEVRGSWLI